MSATAPDTDFYARIYDEAPDGSTRFICRGGLRASHRALDTDRSTRWQPYHPHTETDPLRPGEEYELAIEIWPSANVYKEGHRIRLKISTTEDITEPGAPYLISGGMLPRGVPASRNTILEGSSHPSRLVVPVIPA
jgi:hypothetical protein